RASFAADRPTLAGVWSESIMAERWNIGQWGAACGPKPVSRDVPGGQVTIKEEGAELVVTGTDRTYRTAACYETMPGLVQSSHSVTQRSWQTRCVSTPSDPRQTTLVTNLTATDTTMSLDETGAYQFTLHGQNCTASTRRTRTYRLIQRQGESAPPPPAVTPEPTRTAEGMTPAPPLTAPSPSPTPFSRPSTQGKCAELGEPTRLEVTPVRKLLRPGDRFTFRTQAYDASGCVVPPKATWAIATPDAAGVTVAPGGVVTVADDAVDGVIELSVSFAGKAARVRVEVATAARYEALLSTASTSDAGEAEEAATIVASGSLSANSAVAQDGARARKTTFVVIIGTLALGLAALGFFLMRRTSKTPRPAPESTPEPIAYIPNPGAGGPTPGPRAFGGRSVVCPSCRGEYPAGSTFCPRDGNRLVEPNAGPGGVTVQAGGVCPTCGRGYDPGVRTCPVHGDALVPAAAYRPRGPAAGAAPERGKICPSCGGRYGGEATFCGKDGTALVLVN
ncbi:MAG: hypothetical protein ABW133_25775, partial [Polyangiaceae bacterium]